MGAALSVRRVAIAVLGILAVTALLLLSSSPAEAQDFSELICGILQSLGGLFGGLLTGILGFLLELFGCAPASP